MKRRIASFLPLFFVLLWVCTGHADASVHIASQKITTAPTRVVMTEEAYGGKAYVVALSSNTFNPDYKWQFLTGGVRMFIDRKDGIGWVQIVSTIQTAPEYLKHTSVANQSVWQPYALTVATTGSAVLQGYAKEDASDGSVKFTRIYTTSEEGVQEVLTEQWTVPALAVQLGKKGPKVSYSMTKHRGIRIINGVSEGTWRMTWHLAGISDIQKQQSNLTDDSGKPISEKDYSENGFKVDVSDFKKTAGDQYSYSENPIDHSADVLFFKNGLTGERVVDPTLVVSALGNGKGTDLALPASASVHNAWFNGTYFIIVYDDGTSNHIFARVATTLDGLASATDQTLVTRDTTNDVAWSVFQATDTKIVVVYASTSVLGKVSTCTLASTTFTCTASTGGFTFAGGARQEAAMGVTMSQVSDAVNNRIWVSVTYGDGATTSTQRMYFAGQKGDAGSVTSFTQAFTSTLGLGNTDITGYNSADKAVAVFQNTGSTGKIYSEMCNTTPTCTAATVASGVTNYQSTWNFGQLYWISDSNIRFTYGNDATTDFLKEVTLNAAGTTWSIVSTPLDDATRNPSIFPNYPCATYDAATGDEYQMFLDSNQSVDPQGSFTQFVSDVERNISGTTTWSDLRPIAGPMTHSSSVATTCSAPLSVPIGSTRVRPRWLVWSWQQNNNAVGSLSDLYIDAFSLTPDVQIKSGTAIKGGTKLK